MVLTEHCVGTELKPTLYLKCINRATLPKIAKITVRALIWTLLILVWGGSFSPVAEAIIKLEELVVALPFDEGAGKKAADLSPHGNDALLVEDAKWADGKFGKCIRVKKPAHAEVENNESFQLHDTDFTLAIWINFTEVPGTVGLIAHDDGLGAEAKKAVWELLAGLFVFHINNGGNKVAWIRSDFFGDPELGRWYSVVLVKKGKTYTHYLDGELFGEKEEDEPIPQGINNPLTIGLAEHTFYFGGLIDEVVVSHTAWTQQDAQRYFAGGIERILAVQPGGKLANMWGSLKSDRTF